MAGLWNPTIEQGATFSPVLTWKDEDGDPADLPGYTARMYLKRRKTDDTAIVELTTENGGLTLGGALGTIAILITATVTATLDYSGVYDLEMVSGTNVRRLVEGNYPLSTEVTK